MFKLEENGTSVRTELLAGLTTYMTMVYIAFVNPAILAEAGMDKGAVFVATCLAAAFGSALMGLYANFPVAMAPGMGLNAYFTYSVVKGMGLPWEAALARCSPPACCSYWSASRRCASGSSTASRPRRSSPFRSASASSSPSSASRAPGSSPPTR